MILLWFFFIVNNNVTCDIKLFYILDNLVLVLRKIIAILVQFKL